MRVTPEHFGDIQSPSCPETTLLSVTDNACTDHDIRLTVGIVLHVLRSRGGALHRYDERSANADRSTMTLQIEECLSTRWR